MSTNIRPEGAPVPHAPADGGTGTVRDPERIPHRGRKLFAAASPLWADNNEGSILTTLAPIIISELGLAASALGLLTSVSKFISIFFGPFWAWAARKTNRKGVLVWTTVAVALLTAAAGLAQNFAQLLIVWSFTAVFIASSLPIVSEITADLFDEKSRGKANGNTYGILALVGSLLGPLIGQLANVPNGWRIGFFASGVVGLLVATWVAIGFKDPGVGATEPALRDLTAAERNAHARLTWKKVGQLIRIPSFALMLGQRLLSGHLLISTFGILFLVNTYGFRTATAAVVTLPFGLGYLAGTFFGGLITDVLNRRRPNSGRVMVLQVAQFAFGFIAILGTQFSWGSIGIFAVFWALMGLCQGINPGVNRPIVMAVVPPELRGAAFALMLSVFEALAFVIYNLAAGFLADAIGLQNVFLWIPGILMLVNGVYVTLLYRTYPRDVAKLAAQLEEVRTGSLAAQAGDAHGPS
ncbi:MULTISPECIES: MFS transporter [unclassified Leifsonia]|uniref:MFS transporter n=1 Tax=unclassified Leifsonia TaxID=2663824 RepID=UPI0008A7ABA1|nr:MULTISPECIES: MFS transporter [unclassified Leifsonia]SEI15106.1 Predicted arabinose efflux permease, MFS family [Leifsonia sp. CL154]SFM04045.1 Predicted arabinose efflux permease, MFS family [Leifsonia sp. CL147]